MPEILKVGPAAIEKVESFLEPMTKNLLLLCISMCLNYMFFVTRVTKYFILKKINRSMELISAGTLIELAMFVLGMLTYLWGWNLR
jgi:hypothetical protein